MSGRCKGRQSQLQEAEAWPGSAWGGTKAAHRSRSLSLCTPLGLYPRPQHILHRSSHSNGKGGGTRGHCTRGCSPALSSVCRWISQGPETVTSHCRGSVWHPADDVYTRQPQALGWYLCDCGWSPRPWESPGTNTPGVSAKCPAKARCIPSQGHS